MEKILIVDDEPHVTLILEGEFLDAGYEVSACNSSVKAIELIQSENFDLVITDLSMPEKSGIDVLEAARGRGNIGVIIMTAHSSIESAVEAGQKGVAKYIEKPFENTKLLELARQTLDYLALTGNKSTGDAELESEFKALAHGIVFGQSPAAAKTNELIKKVAPAQATALLSGPSGSGKEIAARLIHQLSPRKDKPFVAVNCAALAETLLESELFGHEKGSFTGATERKRGKFELADGGVIFLDEIGETSPGLQTKLLRVLEERTFTRVGGSEEVSCDVRVIAATNRDLQAEITRGNFREDLFFRLNVFPIIIPSLSERSEDIPEFVRFFLEANRRSRNSITPEALRELSGYSWPGNIRELRNVIERASILAGDELIAVEHLDLSAISADLSDSEPAGTNLESAEREMIVKALAESGGNKTTAADKLGITRRKLYSRLKILGIEE